MSNEEENSVPRATFPDYRVHRPRMTYDDLSVIFDEEGALVLENLEDGKVVSQATICAWQIDVVLAFINKHRLSEIDTIFARKFSSED